MFENCPLLAARLKSWFSCSTFRPIPTAIPGKARGTRSTVRNLRFLFLPLPSWTIWWGRALGRPCMGDALLSFHPDRFPIWTDDRLRFTQTLEERLLGGALLHSQERRVVLLPHRLPRFAGGVWRGKWGGRSFTSPWGRFSLRWWIGCADSRSQQQGGALVEHARYIRSFR